MFYLSKTHKTHKFFLFILDLTSDLAEDARAAAERAQAVIAVSALDAVFRADLASLVPDEAALSAAKEEEDGTAKTAAAVLNLFGVVPVLDAGDLANNAERAAVVAAVADTRAPSGGHLLFFLLFCKLVR